MKSAFVGVSSKDGLVVGAIVIIVVFVVVQHFDAYEYDIDAAWL